jgi:MoaA/NifB/PqqE/SkfB family radical SAM enzyme
MQMNYQIEADWHLLNTCNYRCQYCFFSPQVLGDKLRTFASPQEWQQAFDSTGYRWLLHMTGGEPGIYPQFVALCEALTDRHFISLNSNLSHRSFETFAGRIDPKRVSFINAGFHLEERERHGGNDIFLRNAAFLLAREFRLLVSLIATPHTLARFEKAIDLLAPIGLVPVPKAIRGLHAGKHYPAAYTAEDKSRFRHFAALARKSQTVLQTVLERPTVDMLHDDEFLDGLPSFTGRSCEAGRSFVRMDPSGEAFRCGTSESLGNVLQGSFVRHAHPTPCDTNYCPYFCLKYAEKMPPPGQVPI